MRNSGASMQRDDQPHDSTRQPRLLPQPGRPSPFQLRLPRPALARLDARAAEAPVSGCGHAGGAAAGSPRRRVEGSGMDTSTRQGLQDPIAGAANRPRAERDDQIAVA